MRRQRLPGLTASALLWLAGAVALPLPAAQAQNEPHLGYIYPAGGQIGTMVRVTVGGQYLTDTAQVLVTGEGIEATIGKHKKPLNEGQASQVRTKIDLVRDKFKAEGKEFNLRTRSGAYDEALASLQELGVTEETLTLLDEFEQQQNDVKRQLNPAIEETVILDLKIDAAAAAGRREVRLRTAAGVSNPIAFHVGMHPEFLEQEPNDAQAGESVAPSLPAVLNGQILPGDVDRFRFTARKGEKLVLVVLARQLVPYLADAVPGWFQATLALYDADRREVAFADDYRFHPDPVLFYRVPRDGTYELEIRDSIYRGREDFVYRITVGELPFLTHVFPLGIQTGQSGTVEVYGWNLPVETISFDATDKPPGRYLISVEGRQFASNQVPFTVDALPELREQEPNNDLASALLLKPPIIVNGRIDQPGDWDVYRFDGRAGGQVIVEVLARRLESPMDSVLMVTDADGRQLMFNDDCDDLASGLTTHHADSQLHLTLPADGSFFIHVGDTQNKGGPEYAYRLRVSARRPDFELRVVPSAISARPGSAVPVTVHAARRDGFDQDIRLSLKDPPAGFTLGEASIPAGQSEAQVNLKVPAEARDEPYVLQLEGRVDVRGREVVRAGVPADNMMQAFAYFHLVPAEDLVVYVTSKAAPHAAVAGKPAAKPPANVLQIPAGGMVRYPLTIPNRTSMEGVSVELSEAPAGVSLVRVIRNPGGLVMLISADAEIAKPGLQGSLTLNVFAEDPAGGSRAKRRISLGTFPPVPFEVVER